MPITLATTADPAEPKRTLDDRESPTAPGEETDDEHREMDQTGSQKVNIASVIQMA